MTYRRKLLLGLCMLMASVPLVAGLSFVWSFRLSISTSENDFSITCSRGYLVVGRLRFVNGQDVDQFVRFRAFSAKSDDGLYDIDRFTTPTPMTGVLWTESYGPGPTPLFYLKAVAVRTFNLLVPLIGIVVLHQFRRHRKVRSFAVLEPPS